MKTISYTALDTFYRCPRKFKFSYVDRLTKQEFILSPMTMGSAIHVGMSYGLMLYYASEYKLTLEELNEQLESMFIDWREVNKPLPRYKLNEVAVLVEDESTTIDFYEMVDTVKDIVYRTFVYLDVPNNWRTVIYNTQPLIEWRDEVEIIKDSVIKPNQVILDYESIMFQFQIDWVATNLNDGLTYLIDWKSRRSFQDAEKEASISGDDFNVQMSLYQKALQILGVHTDATMTFQISPHNPKKPDWLESRKRVSKSNIKTDWETYAAALVEYGESPDDPYYADMKEKLSDPQWFSPIIIFRPQVELDTRWRNAQNWTRIIYGNDQAYLPMESPMCVSCPFSKICLGVDRGYDVDEIIKSEYNLKEKEN